MNFSSAISYICTYSAINFVSNGVKSRFNQSIRIISEIEIRLSENGYFDHFDVNVLSKENISRNEYKMHTSSHSVRLVLAV